MNPFEEDPCWNVLDDYTTLNDFDVSDFYLTVTSPGANATAGISLKGDTSVEKGLKRVRGEDKTCFQTETKSSRERLRREKMNDRHGNILTLLLDLAKGGQVRMVVIRFGSYKAGIGRGRRQLETKSTLQPFSELRQLLNPGSAAKSDKSSVLHDAICAVHMLKSEHKELKERKKKLQDDTLNLKEEKKELKEEKLNLQAKKQNIEQQLKATTITPSDHAPMHPAIHQGGGHKGVVVSGYGGYPMWQWIPLSVLDTSQDHVLRPPVA